MPNLAEAAKPILSAALCTAISVLVFAALQALGASGELSLLTGTALAGALSVRRLASLNCEALLPTSQPALGEPAR